MALLASQISVAHRINVPSSLELLHCGSESTNWLRGVRSVHKTLDDATEALAAIICVARSDEAPPDPLMKATDKVVDEMTEWRAKIKETEELRDGLLTCFIRTCFE